MIRIVRTHNRSTGELYPVAIELPGSVIPQTQMEAITKERSPKYYTGIEWKVAKALQNSGLSWVEVDEIMDEHVICYRDGNSDNDEYENIQLVAKEEQVEAP